MKLNLRLAPAVLLTAIVPGALCQMARADIYHAVETGETLTSIAARYGTQTEVLRRVNNLRDTADNAPLPAMLVRVPEGNAAGTAKATTPSITPIAKTITVPRPLGTLEVPGTAIGSNTTSANSVPTASALSEASGAGVVSTSMSYTVKVGDTFESIAAACAQRYGMPVAADDIRQKNRVRELVEGMQLTVPLRSTTMRPVTQQALQQVAALEPPVNPVGDATVSNEVALPVAKMAALSQPPLYQAPNMPRAETPQPERRGPSVLASRGFMPSPDGLRVLDQREDAPNTNPNPALKDAPPQARVTQPPTSRANMAQVARIAKMGGNIRRLPEASAVSLYRCPVGTELAVTRQQGPWSAILMSDRSTGWIPTRYLKFLNASVDISTQVLDNAKMDRADGFSSGSFRSNNPMVQQALSWLGTPYSYGGTGRSGIDCSSLVQHSFASCGYQLPRTAAEQSRVGHSVDPSDLQPGDRLYFSASGSRIDHTGLYMGNGQFVHASGRGRCVMVSNLFEPHNWNIFVGARR